MYVFHILVFFSIFAFNYISYVPTLWYARILSSIRKKNQPKLNPTILLKLVGYSLTSLMFIIWKPTNLSSFKILKLLLMYPVLNKNKPE